MDHLREQGCGGVAQTCLLACFLMIMRDESRGWKTLGFGPGDLLGGMGGAVAPIKAALFGTVQNGGKFQLYLPVWADAMFPGSF